ncbi:f-box protein [Fusarium langsethiae]|uniref:F-box protein n=1 Tax=Fusarium langsethiae TaxID=179993 RepID=A0A0M9ENA9_FUSLA|nr:f-box protein [Fusarium langsethiae]GKU06480.1 unnamed protein product [Fusarium langsethiae]GKU20481.1 unnamed protein product [Fusarium langsethiae]
MSSSLPIHVPPTEDEALVHWMQIRSSIFWHDGFSPESRLPVRRGLAPAVQNSYLLNLPTECLQQIILLLDIESLFTFRQTSIGMQQKVDSLFEFRKAKEHAPDLLGATFKCMVAEHISLSEFYYQLCNKYCVLCNNLADCINLQT